MICITYTHTYSFMATHVCSEFRAKLSQVPWDEGVYTDVCCLFHFMARVTIQHEFHTVPA